MEKRVQTTVTYTIYRKNYIGEKPNIKRIKFFFQVMNVSLGKLEHG